MLGYYDQRRVVKHRVDKHRVDKHWVDKHGVNKVDNIRKVVTHAGYILQTQGRLQTEGI